MKENTFSLLNLNVNYFTVSKDKKLANAKDVLRSQWSENMKLTSLLRAAVAVWRSAGSIARRVSINGNDDGGKSLNVSAMQRLYGC